MASTIASENKQRVRVKVSSGGKPTPPGVTSLQRQTGRIGAARSRGRERQAHQAVQTRVPVQPREPVKVARGRSLALQAQAPHARQPGATESKADGGTLSLEAPLGQVSSAAAATLAATKAAEEMRMHEVILSQELGVQDPEARRALKRNFRELLRRWANGRRVAIPPSPDIQAIYTAIRTLNGWLPALDATASKPGAAASRGGSGGSLMPQPGKEAQIEGDDSDSGGAAAGPTSTVDGSGSRGSVEGDASDRLAAPAAPEKISSKAGPLVLSPSGATSGTSPISTVHQSSSDPQLAEVQALLRQHLGTTSTGSGGTGSLSPSRPIASLVQAVGHGQGPGGSQHSSGGGGGMGQGGNSGSAAVAPEASWEELESHIDALLASAESGEEVSIGGAPAPDLGGMGTARGAAAMAEQRQQGGVQAAPSSSALDPAQVALLGAGMLTSARGSGEILLRRVLQAFPSSAAAGLANGIIAVAKGVGTSGLGELGDGKQVRIDGADTADGESGEPFSVPLLALELAVTAFVQLYTAQGGDGASSNAGGDSSSDGIAKRALAAVQHALRADDAEPGFSDLPAAGTGAASSGQAGGGMEHDHSSMAAMRSPGVPDEPSRRATGTPRGLGGAGGPGRSPPPRQLRQHTLSPRFGVPNTPGRRTKQVHLNGHELGSLAAHRVFAVGVLLSAHRARRRRRQALKAFAVGLAAGSARRKLRSKLATLCFSVGLCCTALRQASLRRRSVLVFSVGLGPFELRSEAKRLAKQRQKQLKKLRTTAAKKRGAAPKLKGLHWEMLDNVHGTVWDPSGAAPPGASVGAGLALDELHAVLGIEGHEASKAEGIDTSLEEFLGIDPRRRHALQSLFGDLSTKFSAASATGGGGKSPGKSPKKPPKARKMTALDGQASQNINIGLSALGKVSFPQLAAAIDACDISAAGGPRILAVLQGLPAYSPALLGTVKSWVARQVSAGGRSMSDASAVKAALDKAGPAEAFIWHVVGQVQSIEAKLQALLFSAQCEKAAQGVQVETINVCKACEQVTSSTHFITLLRDIILPLGNQLNAGSRRGAAVGFKLSALHGLTATKASDNQTLLEYILDRLLSRQSPILDVLEELAAVPAAAKTSLSSIDADFAKLEAGMQHVQDILQSVSPAFDEFRQGLEPHAERLKSSVQETSLAVSRMHTLFSSTCTFFGENPETTSCEQLFGMLDAFCSSFKAALDKVQKAAEAKRRKEMRNAAMGKGRNAKSPPAQGESGGQGLLAKARLARGKQQRAGESGGVAQELAATLSAGGKNLLRKAPKPGPAQATGTQAGKGEQALSKKASKAASKKAAEARSAAIVMRRTGGPRTPQSSPTSNPDAVQLEISTAGRKSGTQRRRSMMLAPAGISPPRTPPARAPVPATQGPPEKPASLPKIQSRDGRRESKAKVASTGARLPVPPPRKATSSQVGRSGQSSQSAAPPRPVAPPRDSKKVTVRTAAGTLKSVSPRPPPGVAVKPKQ